MGALSDAWAQCALTISECAVASFEEKTELKQEVSDDIATIAEIIDSLRSLTSPGLQGLEDLMAPFQ
eukprot:5158095-Pyramimonas_sp.AAC.1